MNVATFLDFKETGCTRGIPGVHKTADTGKTTLLVCYVNKFPFKQQEIEKLN